MRHLGSPRLNAFKLEIPHFFDGRDCHLVDDGFEEDRTVLLMPFFGEFLVIDDLLPVEDVFGMFLKEPEDDSGGPFFAVKIVKLKCILLMKLIYFQLASLIEGVNGVK